MIETGDLDISLLYAIMARAGQMRGRDQNTSALMVPGFGLALHKHEQKRSCDFTRSAPQAFSAREFIFYHPIAANTAPQRSDAKSRGTLCATGFG